MAKFNKSKDHFFQKLSSKKNLKPSTEGSNDFFVRSSNESEKKQKKPFDKKKWRLQKYSIKHKVENWEEKRKNAIVRRYHKQRKQEKNTRSFNVGKIYEEEDKRLEEEENLNTNKRRKVFKKPHEEFLEQQEEKKRKREEFLQRKAEKEEAMERYKKKKVERYKKLNRKTKHGQPIMKDRMEMLLEQIQQSISNG